MRAFLGGLGLLGGILVAADLPAPKFRAVNVDTNITIGYGLAIADVDGDRRPDIVLCDKAQVAWYRNPGWEKFVIAEKLTELDHVCVAAADVDGDGKAEIAVGAGWNPGDTVNSGAVFYLIPPFDRTQKWEPVKLPHEPTVHRMRWVQMGVGKYSLVVVPLHGRGNNALKGEGEAVKILSYEKPANPRDPWTVTPLSQPNWPALHKTHNLDPGLKSASGSDGLAIASKEGLFFLPGGSSGPLVLVGTNGIGGAGEIRIGRLSGQSAFFAAVEPMHGNTLAVYTKSSRTEGLRSRQVIDESLIDGHALACGDLLGLGRDQIVVGWRAMNRPGATVGIRLYTPIDTAGTEWRMTPVDDNTMACEDLALADLNGDGRLDIIAAGRATRNVKVWFNER